MDAHARANAEEASSDRSGMEAEDAEDAAYDADAELAERDPAEPAQLRSAQEAGEQPAHVQQAMHGTCTAAACSP